MKTPREFLLARHRSANAKLDRVRTNALSTTLSREPRTACQAGQAERPLFVRAALRVWHELIWPCRRIWAGLAAAWAAILGVNTSLSDPVRVAAANPPPSPQMLLVLREQRRVLTELIQTTATEPAEPPRPGLRPRTERRPQEHMA